MYVRRWWPIENHDLPHQEIKLLLTYLLTYFLIYI